MMNLVILLCLLAVANALNVTNIQDCPALTPRSGPVNAQDLRIDDIKAIGALGDRYTTCKSKKKYLYILMCVF